MARRLKKLGISTSISSRGSYKERLVRAKDPIPYHDNQGVVYHIGCDGAVGVDCKKAYIGETGRSLVVRLKDHKAPTKHGDGTFASAVKHHVHTEGHYYAPGNVTILDKEDNWHNRGIREAIQIRALKPGLNRDQGRVKLPGCYDDIINEFIAPGSRRKVEASRARQGPSWPQTQPTNGSGDRGDDGPLYDAIPNGPPTDPDTQTGNIARPHPTATTSQTDPKIQDDGADPRVTLPKRGRGRPRGGAASNAPQLPGRPSTHGMSTRHGGRRLTNGHTPGLPGQPT